MELLYLLIYTLLFLSFQAFAHKYMILHANSQGDERLYAMKKWHFWTNVQRISTVLGAIILALIANFTLNWFLPLMIVGLGIFGGYYFSIFLNLIRGLKWNWRGGDEKKDFDYYMFGGVTPTLMMFISLFLMLMYLKYTYNL